MVENIEEDKSWQRKKRKLTTCCMNLTVHEVSHACTARIEEYQQVNTHTHTEITYDRTAYLHEILNSDVLLSNGTGDLF